MIELRWLIKQRGHGVQPDEKALQYRDTPELVASHNLIPCQTYTAGTEWKDVPEVEDG